MRKLILAGAAILLLSGSAMAEDWVKRGDYLLKQCLDREYSYQKGFCTGFISAQVEGFEASACIPPGVNFGQVMNVIIQFLQRNPHRAHESAVRLAMEAVTQAWPMDINKYSAAFNSFSAKSASDIEKDMLRAHRIACQK